MVVIPPEFKAAELREEDMYEGTEVDKNVADALPEGSKIEWVVTHGATHWAISTKIDTELHGEKKSYFLKEFRDANGADMGRGEYEATAALYAMVPRNVPEPIAHGDFFSDPSKHFFLAEFRDMSDELPATDEFVSILAKIHQQQSPTGKFGFPVKTFQGNVPFDNTWCETWEELFTRIMRNMLETEKSIQGSDPEMDELAEKLVSKVIPRLLRPMETGGNQVKPVLLHADLWHGNVGVDMKTDEPVLYDCGSFYGHNEYDHGMWRRTRYRLNRTHIRAYHKLVEFSPPAEDHDDRNALYALRNDLQTSCAWSANKRMRELAVEEMRRLVAKYPDGFEGYSPDTTEVAECSSK